eukprot:8720841-Karenia_brevis.AAC.1
MGLHGGTVRDRRNEDFAAHYHHLALSSTQTVHSKRRCVGGKVLYVAARRVKLPDEVARRVAEEGKDPLLRGCITWRLGGTQKADGLFSGARRD